MSFILITLSRLSKNKTIRKNMRGKQKSMLKLNLNIDILEKSINHFQQNRIQYIKQKIKEDKYARNNRKHTTN